HKYTVDSVEKTVFLSVFLGGLHSNAGYRSKSALQKLSEN
ncbi:MAG: IS5/IS1182 family transposase, partial [Methanobacteriaceae archaeon]